MELTLGATYSRRADLHAHFGGNQQSGIVVSRRRSAVLLFSAPSGKGYGYRDEPQPDGTYLYTGEGRRGDQRMTRGNLAVRDHLKRGLALHLFEATDRKGLFIYTAAARCIGTREAIRPDVDGRDRRTIVFILELCAPNAAPIDVGAASDVRSPTGRMSLDALRRVALTSSRPEMPQHARLRIVRASSEAIRLYALRRARGICELCEQDAPFKSPAGSPFLEVHHLDRRTDGGPDHPSHVGALCPNCHRAVHHAHDARLRNDSLRKRVLALEARMERVATPT